MLERKRITTNSANKNDSEANKNNVLSVDKNDKAMMNYISDEI